MGTLKTMGERVLRRLRDTGENLNTENDIIDAVNGCIDFIHDQLVAVESSMVLCHDTISLVDGTKEYDLNSGTWLTIPEDALWIDGEDEYLIQVPEASRVGMGYEDDTDESQPEYFYVTNDGKIGFIETPDDSYTVHVYFYKPSSEYHVSDFDNDDLPFRSVWNRAIEELVMVMLKDNEELPTAMNVPLAESAWNYAMRMTYERGTRMRKQKQDFFEIDGV